jgi:hypothetical protein
LNFLVGGCCTCTIKNALLCRMIPIDHVIRLANAVTSNLGRSPKLKATHFFLDWNSLGSFVLESSSGEGHAPFVCAEQPVRCRLSGQTLVPLGITSYRPEPPQLEGKNGDQAISNDDSTEITTIAKRNKSNGPRCHPGCQPGRLVRH